MKPRILVACLLLSTVAFAAETGAELFQKALTAERAAGNLEEAIKLYQRVAKEFASDRALAAKALVQEARCYEKLGKDNAVRIYQQVAREYKDQPEPSAAASARLAALKLGDRPAGPATITQRKIELAGHSFDFANTDGRNFVYRDPDTHTVMFGDLRTGQSRPVFKFPWDHPYLVPSKDMSMLFIYTEPSGKGHHAVVRMDGTGYRELQGSFSGRPEWSWDDRYVLMCEDEPDGTRQRARISVRDGSVLTMPGPARCFQTLSPDGHYIASASNNQRNDISVGPTDGEEAPLALPGADSGNARLFGWTRDGRYLALAIDRSGGEGLYLVPMKGGKAAGDPVLVRYGSFQIGQVFANGSLVYESVPAAGQYATWLATLDSSDRVERWDALPLDRGGSPTAPAWSPDANRIAYVASNGAAGQSSQTVHVRDLSSGEDRELYHAGPGEMNCAWAAQSANLFCGLATSRNTELFSVSVESGSAREIGSLAGSNHLLDVAHDDGAIYISSSDGQLIRWDIVTQKSVPQGPGGANLSPVGWVVTSPDKRWVSRLEKGQIEVRELAGGNWRPAIPGPAQVAFSRDGNWLIYHGVDEAGKQSLFRVPVEGGQAERLGDFPAISKVGLMWLGPDGRRIIADSLNPLDTWVLENFEPRQTAAR